MTSAFTISFNFEGKTYLAFARVKENDEGPFCVVNIYNNTLCRIIHGNSIEYSQKEADDRSKFQQTLADRLFHCISNSVSAHLKISN
jgi:hypothetical protein